MVVVKQTFIGHSGSNRSAFYLYRTTSAGLSSTLYYAHVQPIIISAPCNIIVQGIPVKICVQILCTVEIGSRHFCGSSIFRICKEEICQYPKGFLPFVYICFIPPTTSWTGVNSNESLWSRKAARICNSFQFKQKANSKAAVFKPNILLWILLFYDVVSNLTRT